MTYCKESNKLVGSSNFSAWKKRTDLNLIEVEVMVYIEGSTIQPSKVLTFCVFGVASVLL